MSVLKFLISKKFLIHIASALGLIALLLIITFVSLSIYTHHGENYATPDFSGLTERQFIDLVQQKKLRYNIIDSVHVAEMAPGVVVEQTPKPGSKVKENRTIFFTINAFSAEQVPMPQLVDFSLRNAQVTLESYGIKVGKLIYIPSVYTQLVLGQQYKGKPIEPGTLIAKGSTIDLLVGQGLSDEKTEVPDLLGMTLEEARSYCQSNSLNIDAVIYDDSIPTLQDSTRAFIWKQLPDAESGRKLRLGSSLDVWLTIDSFKIMPDTLWVDSLAVDSLAAQIN
ncbi:PASTA domain-containing protein [Saccharicrinis fermentans]|uniref:PASTA domain protein n=1 Tax=Saccharicrinis fermentans DSM 9555 = JCM 21142 TaxID=869213 RepID=W7Y4N6_9BACT|nr:PASTA domain-containing protein [Saccharicrinis fermentans]GAF02548.1 PASTA domain protein [Saccharicrinis fermentans DSM 9555 = JCM 21142]